jgi:hypothetical protein
MSSKSVNTLGNNLERLDGLIKEEENNLKTKLDKINALVKQLKGANKEKYPSIYKSNVKKYQKLMKQYKEIENRKFAYEIEREQVFGQIFNITPKSPPPSKKPVKKLSPKTIKKLDNSAKKAANGFFGKALTVEKQYSLGDVFGKGQKGQKGRGLKKTSKNTRKKTRKN